MEQLREFKVNICDNGTFTLAFPVGSISTDDCLIESPRRILQTNAHMIQEGHGHNYHIPLPIEQLPIQVEKFTENSFLLPEENDEKEFQIVRQLTDLIQFRSSDINWYVIALTCVTLILSGMLVTFFHF
ncbi:CLUMA_CG016951, isoform A [Clunio marinus]|uniref:CLUMA_CG016951, isoform A n=1 Tax=Clunio marinus TaxID=568069 RepID=A0A1J1IS35_9DIPT|nr:CLUMA_CG016951, isoform A [Clunio marinus]